MTDELKPVPESDPPMAAAGRRYVRPPKITWEYFQTLVEKLLPPSAVFGQDHVWDTLAEVGQRAVILWPLRNWIQRLARKHVSWGPFWNEVFPLLVARGQLEQRIVRLALKYGGDNSPKFQKEVERLVRDHVRKWKIQNAAHPSSSNAVPDDLSQPQLRALADSVPLAAQLFTGKPVECTPKKVAAIWTALTARRPGPTRSNFSEKVLALHRRDGTISDGQIAKIIHGEKYQKADGSEKREMREQIRLIRRKN
jgi:hypothetical protein